MTVRHIFLASASVLCLAAGPAFADGTSGSGGRAMTGLIDLGYQYSDFDTPGLESGTFRASGAALWDLGDNWNAQGAFGFTSDRFFGGKTIALDQWNLGGGLFWRDAAQGAFGGELAYQSLDIGAVFDGVRGAARGELFVDDLTLGAYVTYGNYSQSGLDLDATQLGGYGKFYASPSTALKLAVHHSNLQIDGSPDQRDISVTGEVEYLFAGSDISAFAGAHYGNFDVSTLDTDYYGANVGLRLHFGTGGSLKDVNRSEPLEAIRSPRLLD